MLSKVDVRRIKIAGRWYYIKKKKKHQNLPCGNHCMEEELLEEGKYFMLMHY